MTNRLKRLGDFNLKDDHVFLIKIFQSFFLSLKLKPNLIYLLLSKKYENNNKNKNDPKYFVK